MQQNFRSGLLLQYLPNLMHLAICDADPELIQCLALFCPRLSVLSLENSDINDDIVAHLCSLKRLRSLSLGDSPGLSPFGFAELLRSLPDLRNIGSLLWRYFLLKTCFLTFWSFGHDIIVVDECLVHFKR